ncbi:MAG: nucleotidyltransferase family protein [Bacteroidetes bacterium]|nr:nucleotidyltransferase family protein [Bacteroidota bacterium]
MGSQKADLRFAENESFLQHLIRVYQKAGIQKIIVVLHPAIELNFLKGEIKDITWLTNLFPEFGKMYSLKMGLAQNRNADFCFLQNIDNPFTSIRLIKQLVEARTKADYAVPIFNGEGGHPILLSSVIIKHILQIEGNDRKLNEVLTTFNRINVETGDRRILVNINTPSDYAKFFIKDEAAPVEM